MKLLNDNSLNYLINKIIENNPFEEINNSQSYKTRTNIQGIEIKSYNNKLLELDKNEVRIGEYSELNNTYPVSKFLLKNLSYAKREMIVNYSQDFIFNRYDANISFQRNNTRTIDRTFQEYADDSHTFINHKYLGIGKFSSTDDLYDGDISYLNTEVPSYNVFSIYTTEYDLATLRLGSFRIKRGTSGVEFEDLGNINGFLKYKTKNENNLITFSDDIFRVRTDDNDNFKRSRYKLSLRPDAFYILGETYNKTTRTYDTNIRFTIEPNHFNINNYIIYNYSYSYDTYDNINSYTHLKIRTGPHCSINLLDDTIVFYCQNLKFALARKNQYVSPLNYFISGIQRTFQMNKKYITICEFDYYYFKFIVSFIGQQASNTVYIGECMNNKINILSKPTTDWIDKFVIDDEDGTLHIELKDTSNNEFCFSILEAHDSIMWCPYYNNSANYTTPLYFTTQTQIENLQSQIDTLINQLNNLSN